MSNQTVITEKQARQITGGRKPLVPIEYEEACKALDACESIDDAKYFSDKADALAAWAKIYHDDVVILKAKRLKLKAFHRMGTLARELRPHRYLGRGGGLSPGPFSLLVESGLARKSASQAIAISKASTKELENHIKSAHGIMRTALAFRGRSGYARKVRSDAWLWLTGGVGGPRLMQARTALRNKSAREVAAQIGSGEAGSARQLAVELTEWLDEFEQHLPKAAK